MRQLKQNGKLYLYGRKQLLGIGGLRRQRWIYFTPRARSEIRQCFHECLAREVEELERKVDELEARQ
ncbi:MAG: hypothetical protein KGL39_12325 [Patescibacteria group bacterium]|nr:hypothetical protein [Patescibacteria group bacterium]